MNRYLAEVIGTFCLVFTGCGAIVVDGLTGGAVGHVGISATFGLIVTAMIYAVGNVSGAHLNPAVTAGFVLARRMPARRAGGYVTAQLAGAIVAAGLLRLIFPLADGLGATRPAEWSWWGGALALEAVLTFILMFVILNVSTGHMEKGIMAGVAVGGVIALEALFGGPVSGASMNPARSIAPAVIGGRPGEMAVLWIYLLGPVAGALAAAPTCRLIQGNACCDAAVAAEDRPAGPPAN